jgi:excisionase family DNA binding protein
MDTNAKGAERKGEGLLSVRDVAQRLNCGTRTIRRLAETGRMPPPLRVARLIRFREADIARWIEGGCRPMTGGRA